ncbi:Hypothetical protein R9X50_00543300 [Acrodontium crateriforme]|uniref:Dynactin subunit 5 n=1 Tax=Acrodontium crateriforme TaxID=150365 RepID=A0AAQ3M7K9_9PEZI|nr:Hypothetical protein R9X50_00543300 [Acrodontium crateriforme]
MSRPAAAARRTHKGEYIETDTGNKISRKSHIDGKQHIMLGGRTVVMAGVQMRGDLCRVAEKSSDGGAEKEGPTTAIAVGSVDVEIMVQRGTIISTNSVLRPPMRLSRGQMTCYPMRMGDNIFIGPGSHISAASISSHVYIGANCVLSPFCVIKESCKILPNTVVPPHMIVPPGSIVAGRPGRIIGEVGDGWGQGGGGGEGEEWVEGGDLRPLVRSIK